jgi:hypothetical protein
MAGSITYGAHWRPQTPQWTVSAFKLVLASLLAPLLFIAISLSPVGVGAASLLCLVILLCAGEVPSRRLREIGGACAALAILAWLSRPDAGAIADTVNLAMALGLISATALRASICAEIAEVSRAGEAWTRSVFDNVGSTLWVEDYGGVRSALSLLRDLGVQDLDAYLREDPRFIERMAARVRPIDINARGLAMLDAGSREAFFTHHQRLLAGVREPFRSVLLAYWRGDASHQARARLVGFQGRAVETIVSVTFSREPGSGDRVVFSFTDITALVRAGEAP